MKKMKMTEAKMEAYRIYLMESEKVRQPLKNI